MVLKWDKSLLIFGSHTMGVKERVDIISNNKNISMGTTPSTVKIELTGVCTLGCSFCFNKFMKEHNIRQKFMTKELFNKILSELNTIPSIKEIGLFYMGESGLHKEMPMFYKQIKEQGYFTYLTTNGTITNTIIESIPYVDSLKISWNYKNLDDFILKTNRNEKLYNTIISNIKLIYEKCHENNKKLTISTVLDDDKKDYEDVLKQLYYDDHYWLPLQTQAGINDKGVDGVVGQYDNQSSQLPCWSLFKGLYFDVDGNVRCCCYGHKKEHIIGNIIKTPLNELLKNARLIDIKKKHLQYEIPIECADCLRGCSDEKKQL